MKRTLPVGMREFAREQQVVASECAGVPLLVAPRLEAPQVSLFCAVRAGVKYESADNWGLAHFLEHILMRGNERYPTIYDIARRVEGVGGHVTAYSTRDIVVFWAKVPRGCEDLGLEVLDQILFHPTFKPEFIEAERTIIKHERLREQNSPVAYASQALEGLLLEPSPLSRHPVGLATTLEAITPEVIRAFAQQYYHRSNLLLVASGSVGAGLEPAIERYIASEPEGPAVKPADFSCASPCLDAPVVLMPSLQRQQVFLAAGWTMPVKDRHQMIAWRVANTLLGSGYTSLLNQTLRERESLVYLCNTAITVYDELGIFRISMATLDENLPRVLAEMERIISQVAEGRLDEDIFYEAKVRHAASVIERCGDPWEAGRLLANTKLREGVVFSAWDYLQELESVTLEEVSALVAAHWTPERRRMLLCTGSERVRREYSQAVVWEPPQ